MNQCEHTIKKVLDPVSVDDFFDQYWEQNPLHINRSNAVHFSSLLEITDIEKLLSTQRLQFPQVQLTQSALTISAHEYTDAENQIIPDRFIQKHLDGATIVVSQADSLLPHLADLCREVLRSLQLNCQTNVYLSPAGNQGFNAHYDTHDVFILQVSGAKSFNIYRPGVNLPKVHEAFNPEFINDLELVETIDLAPGDTLYIPRGMVHDAVAQEETSLHITLGVFAVVLRDLLSELVQIAADNESGLRSSIPRKEWLGQGGSTGCEPVLEMLEHALPADSFNIALSRLRDDVALNGAQSCEDVLSDRTLLENIHDNSDFIVNQHSFISCERRDSILHMRAVGKVLEFTEPLGSAVEWILAREQFSYAAVPLPDRQQRFALLDRLLRENLIVSSN